MFLTLIKSKLFSFCSKCVYFEKCLFKRQIMSNCAKKKERSGYLETAETAYKLQVEAQHAAESAIKQLEEFMHEEEKLVSLFLL
jgi:hypothetical protein